MCIPPSTNLNNYDRIKHIYYITKKEIEEGQDIYEYMPIVFYLIREEDFEAAEGIRLAIADLGLELNMPITEVELDASLKYIREKNVPK